MIINIHEENSSVRSLSTPNIPVPDRDALYIRASHVEVIGEQLKSIQVSINDGYNYYPVKTKFDYHNEFRNILVKTQLERVDGYVFKMTGGAKVSGFLSKFGSTPGLFQAEVLDCSDLICDVNDISGLFIDTDMYWQPVLQNRPYIFSETFKHCVSLSELDLSMISNDNLYNSKFYEFLPTTSQIKFSDDCPKDLQVMILDARYEN